MSRINWTNIGQSILAKDKQKRKERKRRVIPKANK